MLALTRRALHHYTHGTTDQADTTMAISDRRVRRSRQICA